MQFIDRKAKYPNRWTLVKEDGTSEVVTLVRNDEPIVEGTPMNADTLNTLSDVAGADVARSQAENAAQEAESSKTASASSAAKSAQSASEAESSKREAAASAEKAKEEADRATAIVSTDKTLSVEGAPADAKVVGERFENLHFDTDPTLTKSGAPADAAAVGEALAGKAEALHTHNYAGSDSAGGTAASVNGFTFAAQTTDPGADSALDTGKVLIVYE